MLTIVTASLVGVSFLETHLKGRVLGKPVRRPPHGTSLVVLAATVHVSQLLEAVAPFVQVVVVLVLVRLGGVEGT